MNTQTIAPNTEINGQSIEEQFRDIARRNHINEYSFLMFYYRAGENMPFSRSLISEEDQMMADQRCTKTVAQYAKVGYDWHLIAIPFPEECRTKY